MFIAAAAMAIVSCEKEITNENTSGATTIENNSSVKMKTITIETQLPESKTTLDANHSNIVWSSGDAISLFNDADDTNTKVTYSQGGDITVSVPDNTTEIYMHYPYYSSNSDKTAASVYIAANQTQTDPGTLEGKYFPMVAKGTVSAENKAVAEIVKQYLSLLHTQSVERTYLCSLLRDHSLHRGDDNKQCYGYKYE